MATASLEVFDRAVHSMLTSHPSVLITSVDLQGTLFVTVTADCASASR